MGRGGVLLQWREDNGRPTTNYHYTRMTLRCSKAFLFCFKDIQNMLQWKLTNNRLKINMKYERRFARRPYAPPFGPFATRLSARCQFFHRFCIPLLLINCPPNNAASIFLWQSSPDILLRLENIYSRKIVFLIFTSSGRIFRFNFIESLLGKLK